MTTLPTSKTNTASKDGRIHRPKQSSQKQKVRRYQWIKPLLQPVLLLAVGILLIVALGVAQKIGWIAAGGGGGNQQASAGGENVRYICPMMCTPAQFEPGRCPVCAMELVPASSSGSTDGISIDVSPAARRVANIRTTAVKAIPLTRKIRAIGEISYDEGTLKTIAAYVDGRLDRLYADYTGMVVAQGDKLALLYSPQLYSSQVELLVTRRTREQSWSTTLPDDHFSGRSLYDSARERLLEFGMTASQIEELEKTDKANSRIHLFAPISGTIIEKLAVEGQYVKTGQPIYRLADLSTVWLMLELFPEDAALIHYGQKVEAKVQSLPGGQPLLGRVAFIDPTVDSKTRTVGVRVVIPNGEGLLRIGDYAKATIAVRLNGSGERLTKIYDPELAGRWISPRHPHIVESAPGNCKVCNVPLVPAAQFGFTNEPVSPELTLVIPRNAVLMAGDRSVVYVETEPGHFEIRLVVLGPSVGDEIAILKGVKVGEQVAYSGNFLIDSQMQFDGNPSLIDPTKIKPQTESEEAVSAAFAKAAAFIETAEFKKAISTLSAEDQALVKSQRICPVMKFSLGSMGAPPKVDVDGTPIFICCEGCRSKLLADPDKYLANLDQTAPSDTEDDTEDPEIAAALAELSEEDQALARKQRICLVTKYPLGSMGPPPKVDVDGTPIFICCEGCRDNLLKEPDKYLEELANMSAEESTPAGNVSSDVSQSGLPPIGVPQMMEPQSDLPPIGVPQISELRFNIPQVQSPPSDSDDSDAVAEALALLSPADRTLAEKQKVCPVTDMPLGSMGAPIKVDVSGRPVFICCEGCRERLLAEPAKYLAKLTKEGIQ